MYNKKENDVEVSKVKTSKEEYELEMKLIKNNLDEVPSFHISNFKTNIMYWPNKKIERLLYKLQEEKFPSNERFLKKLEYEYINLGENVSDSNIYYLLSILFHLNKDIKNEHLLFITTIFQLNIIKEVSMLFIDLTFKSAPKLFIK